MNFFRDLNCKSGCFGERKRVSGGGRNQVAVNASGVMGQADVFELHHALELGEWGNSNEKH
jgi:hypothetical protein